MRRAKSRLRSCTVSLALGIGLWLATGQAFAGTYDQILQAANVGDSATVADLLQRGMDPNTADPSGNSLLMIAARSGDLNILEAVLRVRPNIRKRNKYGDTALMLAALAGHGKIVRRLLESGAEPVHSGWNSLHYAAFSGHHEILRLIAETNASLDGRAPNGQTALMLAAQNGHLESVRVLIDADADMDLEDFDGRTALELARTKNHQAVVEFLIESGAVESP